MVEIIDKIVKKYDIALFSRLAENWNYLIYGDNIINNYIKVETQCGIPTQT